MAGSVRVVPILLYSYIRVHERARCLRNDHRTPAYTLSHPKGCLQVLIMGNFPLIQSEMLG